MDEDNPLPRGLPAAALKLAPRPVPRLQALLIAVAAISAFQLVGTNLSNTFHGVATQL